MDKPRITPTENALNCLSVYESKGLKLKSIGGSGFILPRYWIFDYNGEIIACTKTKHLWALLTRVSCDRGLNAR